MLKSEQYNKLKDLLRKFQNSVKIFDKFIIRDFVKCVKEYNFTKSFKIIAKNIHSYAKDEFICFGLAKFKNYCYRDVHTYTVKEFEKFVEKNNII